MTKQTSMLSPFSTAPESKPTTWNRLLEIVVPAAGLAALMAMVAIALPLLNIFEIGIVTALAILARAWWHSEARKQARFGAQAFVIAGVLSIFPAHAVAVLMGNQGLFAPNVAQFSLVELSLYSSLVFSVLLTFYYWVIFMIWDSRYHTPPQHLWLTVLSASLLLISAQIALELVTSSALASLFSLAIFVLMFIPPILWLVEDEQNT